MKLELQVLQPINKHDRNKRIKVEFLMLLYLSFFIVVPLLCICCTSFVYILLCLFRQIGGLYTIVYIFLLSFPNSFYSKKSSTDFLILSIALFMYTDLLSCALAGALRRDGVNSKSHVGQAIFFHSPIVLYIL